MRKKFFGKCYFCGSKDIRVILDINGKRLRICSKCVRKVIHQLSVQLDFIVLRYNVMHENEDELR